ncbi:MAG: hypothetical protein GKR93_10825 [Gammaproteobacteria bacterium]|nr:hypothetical protein [Gammaproteobacteria bacterium]
MLANHYVPQLTGLSQNTHNPSSNNTTQVIMYSLTTCGYCNKKRRELEKKHIRFTEYFVDKDRSREIELWDKLEKSGYKSNYYGTPTFDVYGIMLPNNPSMNTLDYYIKKHESTTDDAGELAEYRG